MTLQLLHRLHHDAGWGLIAAATLLCLALALIVLAHTTGRPSA